MRNMRISNESCTCGILRQILRYCCSFMCRLSTCIRLGTELSKLARTDAGDKLRRNLFPGNLLAAVFINVPNFALSWDWRWWINWLNDNFSGLPFRSVCRTDCSVGAQPKPHRIEQQKFERPKKNPCLRQMLSLHLLWMICLSLILAVQCPQ